MFPVFDFLSKLRSVDKKDIEAMVDRADSELGIRRPVARRVFKILSFAFGYIFSWKYATVSIPKFINITLTRKGRQVAKHHRREKEKRQKDYERRMY